MARQIKKRLAPIEGELFRANDGPQSAFVASTVHECLYGGRAGGGKSHGLLIAAYNYLTTYGQPNTPLNAIIFRRTYAECKKAPFFLQAEIHFEKLRQAGYPVEWNGQDMCWTFHNYGKLFFGYLEYPKDKYRYQGPEFGFIGFDEGTQFIPDSMKYLINSRMRTPQNVPGFVRTTANPGGDYHKHLFERFAPWLDRTPEYMQQVRLGKKPIAAPGQVLWVRKGRNDEEEWVPEGTPNAKSRTYLPASYKDTPQINQAEYESNLMQLDHVTRLQLMHGDWMAESSAGKLFKHDWWQEINHIPRVKRLIRAWDLAWSTEDDAAWTVGLLMGQLENGGWVILDVIRLRGHEGTTINVVKKVAEIDGIGVDIRLPLDTGKAGIDIKSNYVKALAGYRVHVIPDKGDKFERARTVMAQVEWGNIKLCSITHPTRELAQKLVEEDVECTTYVGWIPGFLAEMDKLDPANPKLGYKDQLDAFTAAHTFLLTPMANIDMNETHFTEMGEEIRLILEPEMTVF